MDEREREELEREEARKIVNCNKFEGVYLPNGADKARIIRIGGFHFEAGSKQYDVWSAGMIKDLGPGIRPYLKEIWLETRKEFLRVSVELEKRMKAIDEAERLAHSQKPERPAGHEVGVRPRQGLLFDRLIEPSSESHPDRIETELPGRPTKSRPQGSKPTSGQIAEKPKETITGGNEPHTPSEQTKKAIAKYKKDRKAGKVKPLIPLSQRDESKASITKAFDFFEDLPNGFGTSNKMIDCEEYRKAASRLLEKRSKAPSIPGEQDWKDLLYIGLFFFEGGMIKFQFSEYNSWSDKIIKVLGESVRPHLEELWERTKKEYARQYVYPAPEENVRVSTPECEDINDTIENSGSDEIRALDEMEPCKENFHHSTNDWIFDKFVPFLMKGGVFLGVFVLAYVLASVVSVLAGLEGRGAFPSAIVFALVLGSLKEIAKEKQLKRQIDEVLEEETTNILLIVDKSGKTDNAIFYGIVNKAYRSLDPKIIDRFTVQDSTEGFTTVKRLIEEAVWGRYRDLSRKRLSRKM